MIIRFLGQSGYVIKTLSTTVVIDPYLSDSVNRVANRPRTLPIPINPEELRADAVVCTHHHLDHLDPDTVEKVDRKIPLISTFEFAGSIIPYMSVVFIFSPSITKTHSMLSQVYPCPEASVLSIETLRQDFIVSLPPAVTGTVSADITVTSTRNRISSFFFIIYIASVSRRLGDGDHIVKAIIT